MPPEDGPIEDIDAEIARLTRDRAELREALTTLYQQTHLLPDMDGCQGLDWQSTEYRSALEQARAALSRATGEDAPTGAKEGGERG